MQGVKSAEEGCSGETEVAFELDDVAGKPLTFNPALETLNPKL